MDELRPGISLVLKAVVKDSDSAKSYGSGLLDVFSTPAMIAFMEKTAMECVQPSLLRGYGTVGVSVDVKHLRASAVGAELECMSILEDIDDRLLKFRVEVREGETLVGKGTHERFIIDEQKFIDKLKLK